MVSPRLIATALWAAPLAGVTVLSAWALYDFLGIQNEGIAGDLVLPLLVGLILLALGLRLSRTILRRLGLFFVSATYFAAHAFFLTPDPAAILAFMTLALVTIELRLLAARFAPMYLRRLGEEDRARLDDALWRSLLRLGEVSATAFLASFLMADLALVGTLPLTTIPSAMALAVGLIVIVFLLALLPSRVARQAVSADGRAPIQTPK